MYQRILLLTISFLFLASCTQYETIYTPPRTEMGMLCVNTCINAKQICASNCQTQKSIDTMASLTQQAITRNQITRPTPYRGDCGCQNQYNECYKSCGGKVKIVCVSGCDEAPLSHQ